MKQIFLLINFVNLLASSFGFNQVCYLRFDGDLRLLSLKYAFCTHIILGFFSVKDNHSVVASKANEFSLLNEAFKFRENWSNVKIMVSIGGGANEKGFHEAAKDDFTRKMFAVSVAELVKTWNLDGIDIDWEFPGWDLHLQDRNKFPLLLKVLINQTKVNFITCFCIGNT